MQESDNNAVGIPQRGFSDFESERIQVTLGGATVFVINVQDYRKF